MNRCPTCNQKYELAPTSEAHYCICGMVITREDCAPFCEHLGDVVRTIKIGCCGTPSELLVHHCSYHDCETTIESHWKVVQSCDQCPLFSG